MDANEKLVCAGLIGLILECANHSSSDQKDLKKVESVLGYCYLLHVASQIHEIIVIEQSIAIIHTVHSDKLIAQCNMIVMYFILH